MRKQLNQIWYSYAVFGQNVLQRKYCTLNMCNNSNNMGFAATFPILSCSCTCINQQSSPYKNLSSLSLVVLQLMKSTTGNEVLYLHKSTKLQEFHIQESVLSLSLAVHKLMNAIQEMKQLGSGGHTVNDFQTASNLLPTVHCILCGELLLLQTWKSSSHSAS
jgi:hypothetical protein